MADTDEPTDRVDDEPETDEERERSFRRIGDSLISSLWGDSNSALKRGQGLVTEVAQGTKEELVRMVSHEVRGFLDKMDAADLVQEIVSGLVIEMKTEIRFRRDDSGRLEPDVRTTETRVESEPTPPAPAPAAEGQARRRPMGQVVKDLKDKVKPKQDKAKQEAEDGSKPAGDSSESS